MLLLYAFEAFCARFGSCCCYYIFIRGIIGVVTSNLQEEKENERKMREKGKSRNDSEEEKKNSPHDMVSWNVSFMIMKY